MALRVVAAYDVSDDNRRARLAARLQRWGDRVQKSVFVLAISTDELAELAAETHRIIEVDKDSLWFWRQCAACDAEALVVGQTKPLDSPRFWIVM